MSNSNNKKKDIREKSDYVSNLINTQGYLSKKDNLALNYLYDIVRYLVKRKISNRNLMSDIPEEIVQNIVIQIYEKFKKGSTHNGMDSAFAYISQCVMSEASKLRRNKYLGKKFIVATHDLDAEAELREDYSLNCTFEIHTVLNIEKTNKIIIKEAKYLLEECFLPVKNKELLYFVLLLAISRQEEKLLNKLEPRVAFALRQLYKDVGSPFERFK